MEIMHAGLNMEWEEILILAAMAVIGYMVRRLMNQGERLAKLEGKYETKKWYYESKWKEDKE